MIIAGKEITPDFLLAVKLGLVPGFSSMNKFGRRAAATSGNDLWAPGGLNSNYITTAIPVEIDSTSANDATGGTGMRTARVYGLGENWENQSEVCPLGGLTPYVLQNNYMRVFRIEPLTGGSLRTNAGNVIVQPQGGGITLSYVLAGKGQTQQAIYCVPGGHTAYMLNWYVGIADTNKNGELAQFELLTMNNANGDGIWAVKGDASCYNIGTSSAERVYGIPSGGFSEKTDIRINVSAVTSPVTVIGGFDLLLVENGYINV